MLPTVYQFKRPETETRCRKTKRNREAFKATEILITRVQISGSHIGEYENDSLLGYGAIFQEAVIFKNVLQTGASSYLKLYTLPAKLKLRMGDS
jgi:hypothetical protein